MRGSSFAPHTTAFGVVRRLFGRFISPGRQLLSTNSRSRRPVGKSPAGRRPPRGAPRPGPAAAAGLALGLIVACGDTTLPDATAADSMNADAIAVPVGEWGGPHVRMTTTDTGASLEFDCAFGRIETPLRPDPDGTFDVAGVVMHEVGGPVAPDTPPPPPKPARYAGWTDGKEMRLTVTVTGDGGWELGTFSLGYGRRATLDKCL
jgi:hypothetical protein